MKNNATYLHTVRHQAARQKSRYIYTQPAYWRRDIAEYIQHSGKDSAYLFHK